MVLRNLFDQYDEPENRLSHALASCLARDPGLLRSFIRWSGCRPQADTGPLEVAEQRLPGDRFEADGEDRGLPDICIYTADLRWALLVESKVQARLEQAQLVRHRRTAERRGLVEPVILTITREPPRTSIPACLHKTWTELYSWARRERQGSEWARHLAEYLEVAEVRMTQNGYLTEGSLTVFDGIRFDDETPYTYGEAKRLLGLMMQALRKREDLKLLGMDPHGKGRPAITGRSAARVWDFLALRAASGAAFTKYPHLTLTLHEDHALAMITLPNGSRPAFRRNLVALGPEGFRALVLDAAKGVEEAAKSVPRARPELYAIQRHYMSQRSEPIVDAEVRFDVRTAAPRKSSRVYVQPQWIELAYRLLAEKRSNIQFGIGAALPYGSSAMKSEGILDIVAGVWCACRPWIVAALGEDL